ncbi:hypothetical protein SAMN05661091_1941 [Paenibacillus uliginis N3/975]|uniref:Uncharacterized protein n=1 Tax=Paenibacillus uliginis N3/975 TaxID=1313296 RepID=A0A1X7H7I5_9BACL|nr:MULTISPECIES: hypothetical protein [Paenibacillus]UNK16774.1 hypothetical protein MNQ98_20030 [Paenibacillus sp. N3/727]SMF81138.1 hypothetical protein SAMN05661091_1941 [Paenibacillus uliginis N3/975]
MLKVGIAVCLLLLAVAGYLAFRNSKLIAEKKQAAYISVPSSEYTLYMTRELTEEDRRTMVPLGIMEYRDLNGIMKAVLCRVTHESSGDLKLEEAGTIMMRHMIQAHQRGTFIGYRSEVEALQSEDEIRMADRLSEAANRSEAAASQTK